MVVGEHAEHRAISGAATSAPPRSHRLKAVADVAIAGVLTAVTSPVTAVCALVSGVKYRAWPFFVHERVGLDERPFRFVKIRTLHKSAPAYADRDELADVAVDDWGRFLRTTHLDELPQLWHVLTRKMSMVGPRPMIASIVDRMTPDDRVRRHSIRPGVTGLWQISEAGSRLVLDAAHYDAHYVDAMSLRLDLWILYRTARQTFGAPPIELKDLPPWVTVPRSAAVHLRRPRR